MLRVPKSAYTLATSSIRKIMAPTSKTAAVSRLLPVTQQDEITEDYCRDDMAIFGVEGVIFRVPKCLFEPGPGKFGPLLSHRNEDDKRSTPLPDLTADEFRALVDFFLPYRCLNREPSIQYWIDLLSISTKYELDLIIPIAIKGIDAFRPEIDPVEKYVLAIQHTVKQWEAPSFDALCQRPDPLTVEEAEKLGVVVATGVFRERERIHSEMMHAANSAVVVYALPNNTTIEPTFTKAKAELPEEQNISSGLLLLPPVSGKNTQVLSNLNANDLANAFPAFSEASGSNQPGPLGPTSAIPQGNVHAFFCEANTSDPVFETHNAYKESTIPAFASNSKFTLTQ